MSTGVSILRCRNDRNTSKPLRLGRFTSSTIASYIADEATVSASSPS